MLHNVHPKTVLLKLSVVTKLLKTVNIITFLNKLFFITICLCNVLVSKGDIPVGKGALNRPQHTFCPSVQVNIK